MARSFNGSSAYLELPSAAVSSEPITMACWFRPANITVAKGLVSVSTAAGNAGWQLGESQNAGCGVQESSINGGGGSAVGQKLGVIAGAWQHMAAVFSGASSRTAYLNAIAGTVETTSISVSGVNRTNIGARYAVTVGGFAAGDIADAAIWNVALTANELASLYQGVRPTSIRAESLAFYTPLDDRWTYERKCGLILSDVGPTGSSEDPPFLQKPRRKYFLFGATASSARRKTRIIFPA